MAHAVFPFAMKSRPEEFHRNDITQMPAAISAMPMAVRMRGFAFFAPRRPKPSISADAAVCPRSPSANVADTPI